MVFIPLSDDVPGRRTPYVMYGIILVNVLVFIYEFYLQYFHPARFNDLLYRYALIPDKIIHLENVDTLITSMFLHGGFMHIFGNMLFLYIFGNNVEDSMGHAGFFSFYILCGLAASSLQILVDPHSTIPTLGASGAIAGVLGAYMITYPRARVNTLIFLGFFVIVRRVSALFFLGIWFIMQLFSGIGSIVAISQGGVAYFSHIGGFLAGVVLCFIFRKEVRGRDEWEELLYTGYR